MKSQLPDRKLQTSCKNCTFAIYDNLTQVGCVANRIEKFKDSVVEAYDNEKEFYVVNQFCNFYRPLSWNNGQQDLDKAFGESALDFDIMIDCNNMTVDFKDYIIKSIQSLTYYKNKTNINLFHEQMAPSEIKSMVLEIYSKFKSVKISVCIKSDLFLHETVLKSKSNCHVLIKNRSFDFHHLNTLNNIVNKDLRKFICANCEDSLVVSNMAYKMNYANDPVNNYDINIKNIVDTSKNVGMYINI